MGLYEDSLEDFYCFVKDVLKIPVHDQPHREIADFISDQLFNNKLLLVPRGCYKTSLASTAYPLWMVLRAQHIDGNPNYRCMIDSSTVRLSEMVMGVIANYCQNPVLEDLYGKLYDRRGHKLSALSLAPKLRAKSGIKEPNFLASGVGAEKTGLHFELIMMDDVVTKENVNTVNGREKTWHHFRMMQGIIQSDSTGQKTQLALVGTRYHDDDVYGRVIKEDKRAVAEGLAPSFTKLIRSAVHPDTGELYFPAVLTHNELDRRKRTMRGLFWAQFMNDPNQEEAPFKSEWLNWKSLMEFPELSRIRITVDTAFKQEETDHGDHCALIVAGWDRWHNLWVLDVTMKDNMTVAAFIDELFRLVIRWCVDSVIVEEDHRPLCEHAIRMEMQRRGVVFPLLWYKVPRTQGKLSRWAEIQPYAERHGGIRICEEIGQATKVEIQDEWDRAPFATHDDFMDALSLHTLYLPVEFSETQIGKTFAGQRPDEILLSAREMGRAGLFTIQAQEYFPKLKRMNSEQEHGEDDRNAVAIELMKKLTGGVDEWPL